MKLYWNEDKYFVGQDMAAAAIEWVIEVIPRYDSDDGICSLALPSNWCFNYKGN